MTTQVPSGPSGPSGPGAGHGRARRRRLPLLVIALIVIVPLLEIYVLVQVGQVIGAWWTIVLLLASGIAGGWLIRREGGRAWTALRTALDEGRMPATELADGGLILIGGTLMLAPGFLTDVAGVLLILPFTRPLFRGILARVVTRRLTGVRLAHGLTGTPGAGPSGPFGRADRPGGPHQGPVVRGEVVDPDVEP